MAWLLQRRLEEHLGVVNEVREGTIEEGRSRLTQDLVEDCPVLLCDGRMEGKDSWMEEKENDGKIEREIDEGKKEKNDGWMKKIDG